MRNPLKIISIWFLQYICCCPRIPHEKHWKPLCSRNIPINILTIYFEQLRTIILPLDVTQVRAVIGIRGRMRICLCALRITPIRQHSSRLATNTISVWDVAHWMDQAANGQIVMPTRKPMRKQLQSATITAIDCALCRKCCTMNWLRVKDVIMMARITGYRIRAIHSVPLLPQVPALHFLLCDHLTIYCQISSFTAFLNLRIQRSPRRRNRQLVCWAIGKLIICQCISLFSDIESSRFPTLLLFPVLIWRCSFVSNLRFYLEMLGKMLENAEIFGTWNDRKCLDFFSVNSIRFFSLTQSGKTWHGQKRDMIWMFQLKC